ncbi:MAG TPA: metallophosphoesterase, partial [Methanobacterium sp.]|nr:metallophosphoesterase [Methanobacterium sp.]
MENWKDRILILAVVFLIIIIVSGFLYESHSGNDYDWNYEQLSLFSHQESNFTFTYSGDERDDKGNFKRMIENINANYPQILFNINRGDLRSQASELYNFRTDYLNPGTMAKFNKPVIFVMGNHELQGDPTGEIYQSLFGSPPYYNFTENNSYFMVIDNANGQSLNETQMNWLKDQLNRSQSYKYKFVFMHTPLYNPINDEEEHSMESNGTGGADALKSLFDKYNVTMIFASHIHNYYNGTWGRTPYIISGGAGAPA